MPLVSVGNIVRFCSYVPEIPLLCLPCRADIVEFARQAVEYPHRRFQILLRSTMGPIDVYLVRFVQSYFSDLLYSPRI